MTKPVIEPVSNVEEEEADKEEAEAKHKQLHPRLVLAAKCWVYQKFSFLESWKLNLGDPSNPMDLPSCSWLMIRCQSPVSKHTCPARWPRWCRGWRRGSRKAPWRVFETEFELVWSYRPLAGLRSLTWVGASGCVVHRCGKLLGKVGEEKIFLITSFGGV